LLDLNMLRLTILLIVAMGFALETLGQDNGQLRPGLAKAAAEGRLDEVWAEARAKEAAADKTAEGAFVDVAEAAPEPEPQPALAPAPALAEAIEPDLVVEPVREVVQAVEDPVFTLESFGNEPVPGEAEARAGVEPEAAVQPEVQPDTLAEDQGQVWYVKADSVNVRAEPSTEAEILGKLGNGEALLLVAAVDDEWARIVIQGDGVEGYVATRFLSPVAP
jgi:uncharacterized protein YgiM (DUF1202 family)